MFFDFSRRFIKLNVPMIIVSIFLCFQNDPVKYQEIQNLKPNVFTNSDYFIFLKNHISIMLVQ